MSNRKLLYFALGGLIFLFGFLVTYRGDIMPQGTLEIEVAPNETSIMVDGKNIGTGRHTVDIGTHHVEFRLDGFKPIKTNVTVSQTTPGYIAEVMHATSNKTKDWVDTPEEEKLIESISDHENDALSEKITTSYPVFSRLPIVFGNGSGGLISIRHDAPINTGGMPSIGIYAQNPTERQLALVWLKNHGYELSDIDVVFHGASIPIKSKSEH